MVTEFIIIRHGESLANASKIYAGQTDIDLSDLGREQARIAAEYFKDEKITAIYASDLKRAYNTALAHSELHGLPVIPSEGLREVFIGEWEGLCLDVVREKWPYEFDVLWKQSYGDMTPPGGEPVFDAGKRMYEELLSIAKKESGKVIIASHAAIIRAFWCYMQGVQPDKWAEFVPFPSNASASFVGFDGENFVPLCYSFDEYLEYKSYIDA